MMARLQRFLIGLASVLALSGVQAAPDRSPWEHSILTVEITHNLYEYLQPWSKRTEQRLKTGVVVGPKQVLTTAESLDNQTLIRLQKNGRGQWYSAKVEWIDYHANLAMLTSTETNFWNDLRPVPLADPVPTQGAIQLMRWRDGVFEARKGEINRIVVRRGRLSFVEHLAMEATCEIKDVGASEVLASGKSLVGLAVAQYDNVIEAIPTSFIKPILEAHKRGDYKGLGFFAFVWQRAQNPALHRALKQTGEPQGVVVSEAPALGGNEGVLQPKDIILAVDGHEVDIQGDYVDPNYGKLMLENLSTRRHWAGDVIPIKILRDGVVKEVKYTIPKADYSVELVPQESFDRAPQYITLGGLLFQELSEPYLRSWGGDWRRRVPFRLAFYEQQKPTKERPTVVILSTVLPDAVNVGYQDERFLAVKEINGKPIGRIQDVQEALRHPKDGFHVIDFYQGDTLQRIVLDSEASESATRRVLERYHLNRASVLDKPPVK